MKLKTAAAGLLLAFFCYTGEAGSFELASKTTSREPQPNIETTYGKTLPPVGFVDFCTRHRDECKPLGGGPVRLALSSERWNLLYQVNTFVNDKVTPLSDQELFGMPERWDFPTDAGDCEDYVLLKKRYLEGLGFPPEALLITVVLDEKGEGHAVLTMTAEGGDFILDNRRNQILRWSDVSYKYLKRQSPSDPTQWVALTREVPVHDGNIAGDGRMK
jgi:predicted transglutaminase-like cysteine proteinase